MICIRYFLDIPAVLQWRKLKILCLPLHTHGSPERIRNNRTYVCINTDGQIFRYPIVQILFAGSWSMAGSYFPRDLSCDGMVGGAKSYWCLLECQLHDVRLNQKENLLPGILLASVGQVGYPLRRWMTSNPKVPIDYRHFRYR